jgi:hypothetical protein
MLYGLYFSLIRALVIFIVLMMVSPIIKSADVLYLASYFSMKTTLVVNSAGKNLPKELSQIPKDKNGTPDYSIGVAFVSKELGKYQTGESYSANSIVILPPNKQNDFTKVTFSKPSQTDLNAGKTWYLNGRYGINYAQGNTSSGVKVDVIVSGDPIDSTDVKSAVIDTFDVQFKNVLTRSTPLGTWPLRRNFQLSLRVSKSGANNFYSNMVFDGGLLEAAVARPKLGIVQSNLVWDDKPTALINNVAKLGSSWLRTDIRGTSSTVKFADIVQQANNKGMQVLAVIQAEAEDYDDPKAALAYAGKDFNALCGYPNGSYRISMTNIIKYKNRLEAYLQALQTYHVRVNAFEIGNEYDWVCFNGDVPFNKPVSSSDMRDFIKKYALILEESSHLIKTYFPESTVLSFSPANCNTWIQTSCVKDPIYLLQKLAMVGGKNYLSYVDGYAIHLYPNISAPWMARTTLLSYANILGFSKAFWITEWGFARVNTMNRYPFFRSFIEYMNSTWQIPVANIFLYNYANDKDFSLVNASGVVDPASRVVMQYNKLLPK